MADVTKEIALEVSLKDSTSAGASAIDKRLEELRKKLLELATAGKQNTDEFKKTEQQIVSLGKQVSALPKATELSVDINVNNAELKKLQEIPTSETVKVGVEVDNTEIKKLQGIPTSETVKVGVDVDTDELKKLEEIPTSETVTIGVDVDANQLSKLSAVPEQITVPVSAEVNDTEYQDFRKEVAEPLPPLPPIGPKDEDVVKFKSAKAELRGMREELLNMSRAGLEGTKAFNDLQLAAGKLQDEIADTGARIKGLASDTKNIDAFIGAIQGITAGFQIAQGAAALFGDENEELQKTLVKVQGAMALANGVQQVANLLQKESALMLGLNTLATKAYAFAVGTATGAMRTFRIALAATGIGAIAVALGFAAEAMGLFSSKTKDAADDQKELKRSLEDTAGTLEYYERKLKANGATEADLAKLRRQTVLNEKAELDRKLQQDVARYGVKNDNYQNSLRQEIELLDIKIKEETKIIDEAAKQRADKDKAERDRRNSQNKAQSDREKAELKQNTDARLAEQERIKLIEIEAFYDRLEFQKKFEADKEAVIIAGMQREGAIRTAQANNELQGQKKRLEDEKFIQDQKVKLASDGFNTIGELATAFAGSSEESQKRAFNINKAAGIAQTIIDTFAAAQGAYKSQMTVPDPSAPIRASVAAGIAIAQGLARVAAISKTQFKSTSTGTPPPTPSGTSSSTPAPTFINPQTTNLGTGELSAGQGQGMQPMRAYVVERDIQQTTSRVRRLSEFATLG